MGDHKGVEDREDSPRPKLENEAGTQQVRKTQGFEQFSLEGEAISYVIK